MNVQILSVSALLLCFAAGVSSPSMGDNSYYRWLDDKGNPVHSDRPPPAGIEYEVVSGSSGLSRRVAAEPEPATDESSQAAAPAADRQELEVIQKNPEVCQQATANLEVLRSSARIRLRNAAGEYEFLSDDEKQEQIEKAQDLISVHCE